MSTNQPKRVFKRPALSFFPKADPMKMPPLATAAKGISNAQSMPAERF
jgi:hypothetical protein